MFSLTTKKCKLKHPDTVSLHIRLASVFCRDGHSLAGLREEASGCPCCRKVVTAVSTVRQAAPVPTCPRATFQLLRNIELMAGVGEAGCGREFQSREAREFSQRITSKHSPSPSTSSSSRIKMKTQRGSVWYQSLTGSQTPWVKVPAKGERSAFRSESPGLRTTLIKQPLSGQ